MKNLFSLFALSASAAVGATIDFEYNNSTSNTDPAFPYTAHIALEQSDILATQTDPGGWSYVDLDSAKNQNRGWGHAARWYLIELAEDSILTISLLGQSSSARPGFTLYTSESLVDDATRLHTFSNNGLDMEALNGPWDLNESPLALAANGHNFAGNSLSEKIGLSAGPYTLAVGNAADSRTSPVSEIFDFTLSSSPVPEPSALLLLGLSGLAVMSRHRC